MSTVTQLLARTRVHLQELAEPGSAPQFQDDEQLIPYISDAHRWCANELASVDESGFFESETTLTVAASTEAANLPSDFLRVVAVEWLVSNGVRVPIEAITRAQLSEHRMATVTASGDTGPKPGYFLRGNTIIFLPTRTTTQTMYLTYIYAPAALVAGDSLSTPTDCDPIVARRAAIMAASDAKMDVLDWTRILVSDIEAMKQRYTKRATSGTVTQVDDTFTRALFRG